MTPFQRFRRTTTMLFWRLVNPAARRLAVHGRHASWVRNVEARPEVRIRIRVRWRSGTATVLPWG